MKPAADLVLHGGLLQMELAGHPHQLDLIAQIADQGGALAFGPARLLELAQQEIDLAVLLQHGDALRLGGMGGDHRPDAQARQQRLDLLRRDALAGRFGQHVVEGAAQRRAPAGALDMAAAAHGGVLLGDGQQLEQDALGLEGAGHLLGGEAGDIGAADQGGLDLGLVPAHHFEQELKQEVRRLLGRNAADHGRRRLGLDADRVHLLIHGDATHSRPGRTAVQGFGRTQGRRPTSLA